MQLQDLDTPCVVVDLDRLHANITSLQAYLDQHSIANRPHVKTHKTAEIAHLQIAAGAAGVTCQKLGEAEAMADAGISDIFIAYNLIGEHKLRRLATLMRRADVSVACDNAFTAHGLSWAAQQAGRPLRVLVEFDSGMHRCGVQTPMEAAALARQIAGLPMLRFGGLMCYPNSEALEAFVRQTRALLAPDGIAVKQVSGGGTACAWQAHTHPELTEHRAGMYVFGDRALVAKGVMPLECCALHVLATVVSTPTPERVILDCGSKTLSSDTLGLEGYGMILEYPEAVIYALSEEHAHVDVSACAQRPQLGERVTVLPNHCCPVVNLCDTLHVVRGGALIENWRVIARGATQ
ncbi:MAG: D-TA family PLP-dependent enzyme [Thermoflexales bacterium]